MSWRSASASLKQFLSDARICNVSIRGPVGINLQIQVLGQRLGIA